MSATLVWLHHVFKKHENRMPTYQNRHWKPTASPVRRVLDDGCRRLAGVAGLRILLQEPIGWDLRKRMHHACADPTQSAPERCSLSRYHMHRVESAECDRDCPREQKFKSRSVMRKTSTAASCRSCISHVLVAFQIWCEVCRDPRL